MTKEWDEMVAKIEDILKRYSVEVIPFLNLGEREEVFAKRILQVVEEAGYICMEPETEGMHKCPEERVREGLRTFSKRIIEDEKKRKKPSYILPFLIT